MKAEFPWMENVCYEPRPLRRHGLISLKLRIFIVLAILAVIGGALAGLNT